MIMEEDQCKAEPRLSRGKGAPKAATRANQNPARASSANITTFLTKMVSYPQSYGQMVLAYGITLVLQRCRSPFSLDPAGQSSLCFLKHLQCRKPVYCAGQALSRPAHAGLSP